MHACTSLRAFAILTSAGGSETAAANKDLVSVDQHDVLLKRALRSNTNFTDDGEARGFTLNFESLTNMFKSADDINLAKMLKKGDSMDDALTILKLEQNLDDLLTQANLQTFTTHLNNVNARYKTHVTAIEVFAKKFGDVPLARMLLKAKTNNGTKKLATDWEQALFNKWMLDKPPKSANDVYLLFKIKSLFSH